MHPSDSFDFLQSYLVSNLAIRVSGTRTATQAYVLAEVMARTSKPIVVICGSNEILNDVARDFRSISAKSGEPVPKIYPMPAWERSAYGGIALSLRTRFLRLSALLAVQDHKSKLLNQTSQPDRPPWLLLTTLRGASQATLPMEQFRAHTLVLSLDQEIPRDQVLQLLRAAGYQQTDPVEDPGCFCVRGEILDVFPPSLEHPIRIEFFGDLIERIRKYDPSSQRTLKDASPLGQVTIPPAREVLIGPANEPILKQQIKSHCDGFHIPKSVRDLLNDRIRCGHYPENSEAWAPFAYERPGSLWEALGIEDGHVEINGRSNTRTEFVTAWIDQQNSALEFRDFLKEEEIRFTKATQDRKVFPPPPSLYRWSEQTRDSLAKSTGLFLDSLEISSSDYRFKTEKTTPQPSENPRDYFETQTRQMKAWIASGFKITLFASTQSQLERIQFLLSERGIATALPAPLVKPQPLESRDARVVQLKIGMISQGFVWPEGKQALLTEGELLGSSGKDRKSAPAQSANDSPSAASEWAELQSLSDLSVGDLVIHQEHGIGRHLGLVRLDLPGAQSDFLLLEYAGGDKLYLPIYRLNLIQKYSGEASEAPLSRLGSGQFEKAKEKVRSSVKTLAFDLIQLYANRSMHSGFRFSPRDATFREFEAQFPFSETPDQMKAIDAALADMESGKLMDRLICGDVGFGKTEVAMRAAFRAVLDGKQVAFLVPTTVLAQQHESSIKKRMAGYPVLIESISRFKSAKRQKEILRDLQQGKVDIIVGTHRLLSKDVGFRDLGLVVIDEEHRFGVEHKERLKTLKVNANILTLSATPIPRTLHLSLSGIRDISLIRTPPVDRLPIRTFVAHFDDETITKAIEFEIQRGGQVFFLHNRVQTLDKMLSHLKTLVPGATFRSAHGQMEAKELEDAMIAFSKGEFQILVCTTIIESGLDLPSANTILINRADTLGLSQLYQIRGRVGRGQERGFAYLLVPPDTAVSEEAKERLETLQKFVELGSGFQIASHDLELRGGGNLLGSQQSGHIAAVGFELYTQLLEEAIQELRNTPSLPETSVPDPEIKMPYPAYLSEDFIPDIHQRLSLYRRCSTAINETSLAEIEAELSDRYGSVPHEGQNLLWLIRIKILLKQLGAYSLTVGAERVTLQLGKASKIDPARIIALASAHPHEFQLTPDSRLVVKIPTPTAKDLYLNLEKLFQSF